MKNNPSRSISYTKVSHIRVEASHLKVGMFVSKLDRPWEQTPFLIQGFTLKNLDYINKVKEYCDYVYIDQAKSVHIGARQVIHGNSRGVAAQKAKESRRQGTTTRSSVKDSKQKEAWSQAHSIKKQDLLPAERKYRAALDLVKSTMLNIRLGRSIDTPAAKEAVSACVDNILHQPDAMLLMSRLKTKDEYTSAHSLNVSIISIALGRYVGLNRKQLNEVGLCGLLHDMGKVVTPDQILNKAGCLSDDELRIMRQHPADGHDILSSTSGISQEAMHVAHAHHERIDGQGYPNGLTGGELSTYNKIVSIADVFDAVTSDRVYKSGATVETALRIIHDSRGEAFDPILVTQFIENIGIYPLGTIVELHTGEIGIVVFTSPEKRLRPWIKIILDKERNSIEPRLVNLAEPNSDEEGNPYWIKASHNPRNFDIDLLKHVHGYLE